ncbi:hypothetical protein [Paeniglutamicibacter antarcticus]|uniref:Uncharacterized protein n=1 Tax=Paeniglutamicibacter antarcticus TaxID=494023 RepID=A0ABP9TKC6_9MICC
MDEPRSIRDQIRQAIDPRGEHELLANLVSISAESVDWLSILSTRVGEEHAQLLGMSTEYHRLMDSMEEALELLVPRGWAPFSMDTKAVEEAISLLRNGNEEEADTLLAGQWDGEGSWRTKRVHTRVSVLGAGEGQNDYHGIFKERARLLWKAREHHEAGSYEASIPLIHAQMEGIVMDVAGGKKFYTKGTHKADLVDPSQLVSIEACLAALQATYGQNVPATQTAGSLSRHGIAHGRELAYDTRVNSAKNWSVLDALVAWARPMAALEAQRLREEKESANAGRTGADELGRRIDDREFRQTKNMLRKLQTSAAGWHRQKGKFRNDLVGGVYAAKDFVKVGLPENHGTRMEISSDGQYAWFWRETISGWFLAAAVGVQERGFGEWLYSGPCPPHGSPMQDKEAWGDVFDTPADWR